MAVQVFLGGRPITRVESGTVEATRLLCHLLGHAVHWDGETQALYINSPLRGRSIAVACSPELNGGPIVPYLRRLLDGAGTTPTPDIPPQLSLAIAPGRFRGLQLTYLWRPFGEGARVARHLAAALTEVTGLARVEVQSGTAATLTRLCGLQLSGRDAVVLQVGPWPEEARGDSPFVLAQGLFIGLLRAWDQRSEISTLDPLDLPLAAASPPEPMPVVPTSPAVKEPEPEPVASAEPEPEPAPEPVPEPAPEPTAEPAPQPTAEPAPEDLPPEPEADPIPEVAEEPAANPTPPQAESLEPPLTLVPSPASRRGRVPRNPGWDRRPVQDPFHPPGAEADVLTFVAGGHGAVPPQFQWVIREVHPESASGSARVARPPAAGRSRLIQFP